MAVAIMFVCNACICRSPLMAFTFAQAVRDIPLGVEWNLQSRGVAAPRPAVVCDFVARVIEDDPDGIGFVAMHRSAPVLADELPEFDLVITATRHERAEIARLNPKTRTRTFTLREAIALGYGPEVDDGRRPGALGPSDARVDYAAMLHARRGLITVPAISRARNPWSYSAEPEDFPDIHHSGRRRHAGGLRELRGLVNTLHAQASEHLALDELGRRRP